MTSKKYLASNTQMQTGHLIGEAIVGSQRYACLTPSRLLSKAKLRIVILWRGGVVVENADGARENVFLFADGAQVGKVEGYADRFALRRSAKASEGHDLVLCSPSRDDIVAMIVALRSCVGADRTTANAALVAARQRPHPPATRRPPGNKIARHELWRLDPLVADHDATADGGLRRLVRVTLEITTEAIVERSSLIVEEQAAG